MLPGCAAFVKQMKRQNSEWGDEIPPPPAATSGPAAEAFAPLASATDRFQPWTHETKQNRVIPEGASLLRAFPLKPEWEFSRSELGEILGRVGYMAVVYRDEESCVWVRGRYYETHLGNGSFGALDLAPFNPYSFNETLAEPLVDEKRHRFPCTE